MLFPSRRSHTGVSDVLCLNRHALHAKRFVIAQPAPLWKIGPLLAPALLLCALSVQAQEEGADAPRFISLKSETVNMREGPSREHRVKWIYHHKGLPLEVLASYDVWRRVRDRDGEIGWMHVALLSAERTALITGEDAAPVHESEDGGAVIARATPGAIGRLEACGENACELDFSGIEGWVARENLWGVYDGERP